MMYINVRFSLSQADVCLFENLPAHSGLSSSKFTAKSCETFMWGRAHKATLKANTERNMYRPSLLTDVFSFHVDQKRAVPPKEI